jgi:predicted membrane-bound spermidine synthase
MRPQVLRAAVVVFTASFCTLVIEIVAGRVLAPYVGVSLYTWTSIIGVVLAGISGGAWAGGWLADRRPSASTLGLLLIASGLTAFLIVPAIDFLAADDGLLSSLGVAMTLLQRVVVLSFLLFFAPAFFLGMTSPVAVRIAMRDVDTAGRVVGRLSALSTLGAIAGTFMTGFYFVAEFGTRATLNGVAVALVLTALLFGDLLGRWGRTAVGAFAVGGLIVALWSSPFPSSEAGPAFIPEGMGEIHAEESQYYAIRVERTVRDDTGGPLVSLHLDHLVHSYNDLSDPSHLEYGYLRIFNDAVDWRARRSGKFRLLFIGGGGYTLPRAVEHAHPGAEIDVVEIDPAVTRVARRFFGVARSSGIRSINEDARWFAMRSTERYDAMFIDAFDDLSVPYHLTTLEFTRRLAGLLTQDGVLAANVIDDYQNGRFLASYIRTLQEVFGESNVALLMEGPEEMESSRSTFVVFASAALSSVLSAESLPSGAYVLPHSELRRYLQQRRAIVLTDDYSPVDNMLSSLFADRFVDEVGE